MHIHTTYDSLQNGHRIWLQGVLFEASNVRRHTCEDGQVVIRFEGRIVGGDVSLRNTGYDGGTYGGCSWVPITLEA